MRSSTKMHFRFYHYDVDYREFLQLKYRKMDLIHLLTTRLEKARFINKRINCEKFRYHHKQKTFNFAEEN